MNKFNLITLAILPALFLASCGRSAESPLTDEPSNGEASTKAAGVQGSASGTVTALDATHGKITLDHGPIADAGWPAMTMAFAVDPALLEGIKVGDKVRFEMTTAGGMPRVTSIQSQ
jgi:Cu/Ag efflux protein CusF